MGMLIHCPKKQISPKLWLYNCQGRWSRSGRGGHGRPTFWANLLFFFNQLVNKLLCWVKQ